MLFVTGVGTGRWFEHPGRVSIEKTVGKTAYKGAPGCRPRRLLREDGRRLRRVAVEASVAEVADVGRSLGMTSVVLFLTSWGVVSFVKGATKARIIQARYTTARTPKQLVEDSVKHFISRAYRINQEGDKRPGVITFEGLASPSVTIAAILLACVSSTIGSLIIVAKTYYPDQFTSNLWWLFVLPSVVVVPWYWRGAERIEEVKLLVEVEGDSSRLWLKGHRDELLEYEASMGLEKDELEE